MLISNTERGLSNEHTSCGYRAESQRAAHLGALSRILGTVLNLPKISSFRPAAEPLAYSMAMGQIWGRGCVTMSRCDNVTNMLTCHVCHVSRRDNSITRQCSIRWWEEEGRGPLHFMHLYGLGLARQPEPEDGQAWLRRRPGGTGSSIPCQCPASLRPGDTRYHKQRSASDNRDMALSDEW